MWCFLISFVVDVVIMMFDNDISFSRNFKIRPLKGVPKQGLYLRYRLLLPGS
jgi:hypothetical protein